MIYRLLYVPIVIHDSTIKPSGLRRSQSVKGVRMIPVWRLA